MCHQDTGDKGINVEFYEDMMKDVELILLTTDQEVGSSNLPGRATLYQQVSKTRFTAAM